MPKVGSIVLTIRGEMGRYEIHYSQKKLFEIRGITEDLFKMTETRNDRFATEAELTESVESAVRKYHKLLLSEKKVIVYRLLLPRDFKMNRVGRGHFDGDNDIIPKKLKGKVSTPHFESEALENGLGFVIEYEVMLEVDDNGKKFFTMNEDGTKWSQKHLSHMHLQMDHTEDREAFFKSLQNNAKNMVVKILAFLGQDDEAILGLIDSGSQKLIG